MWRAGPWKKIWDIGIRGKMWRTLKNFYRKTSSVIRLGKNLTEPYTTSLGVKQGGVLSPALFAIYFIELVTMIQQADTGIKRGSDVLSRLLYADDIVILTRNAKDLTKCLRVVSEYGFKWRCKYNSKKSQILIHGRKPKKPTTFYLNEEALACVHAYKYLGVDIQRNLKWKNYKHRILGKAKRLTIMIKAMLKKNNRLYITTLVNTWNTLVRPILEYRAEIWGFGDWTEAEVLHRD